MSMYAIITFPMEVYRQFAEARKNHQKKIEEVSQPKIQALSGIVIQNDEPFIMPQLTPRHGNTIASFGTNPVIPPSKVPKRSTDEKASTIGSSLALSIPTHPNKPVFSSDKSAFKPFQAPKVASSRLPEPFQNAPKADSSAQSTLGTRVKVAPNVQARLVNVPLATWKIPINLGNASSGVSNPHNELSIDKKEGLKKEPKVEEALFCTTPSLEDKLMKFQFRIRFILVQKRMLTRFHFLLEMPKNIHLIPIPNFTPNSLSLSFAVSQEEACTIVIKDLNGSEVGELEEDIHYLNAFIKVHVGIPAQNNLFIYECKPVVNGFCARYEYLNKRNFKISGMAYYIPLQSAVYIVETVSIFGSAFDRLVDMVLTSLRPHRLTLEKVNHKIVQVAKMKGTLSIDGVNSKFTYE